MEIEKELQKFDLPTAVIEKMAEQYLPLKIKDLADKDGYRAIREARLTVKEKRVSIEKRRKELKEDSLRFGRAVDAEARRITALLEPIESHLEAQEGWWDAEKERLKQEAIKQEQEKLQARIDALRQYNCSIPVAALQVMDNTDFEWTLESVKAEYEAAEKVRIEAERIEAERVAAVNAAHEAERLRLEEIARVQAEKEADIKAEQDRLAAERKAIEDAERERLRKIEEEALAAQRERTRLADLELARVTAIVEERARIEQEAERKRLKEEQLKALLPDKEKLMAWLVDIDNVADKMPILQDKAMRAIAHATKEGLVGVIDYLRGQLK